MTIFGTNLEDRAKDAELNRYLDKWSEAQSEAEKVADIIIAKSRTEDAIEEYDKAMDIIEELDRPELHEMAEEIRYKLQLLLEAI